MAEAIGIASGIVALATVAVQVSQISYDYIQKARNASTSTSRYLQEVLALRSALLKVQEILASPDVVTALPSGASLLPQSFITECHKELEAIKRKLEKPPKTRLRWDFKSKAHDLAWPFQEKDTLELVEKMNRWNNICNTFIVSCNLSVEQISQVTLKATQAHRQDSQRALILDWIHSDTSTITNANVLHNHCRTTCSWILNDSNFNAWLQGDGQMKTLFCAGDPGVGKTTMMSFIVNRLVSNSSPNDRVLYHYFDFRAEPDKHQGMKVIRHLYRQLLEYEDQLPQVLLTLYDNSTRSMIDVTEQAWMDVFFSSLLPSFRTCIVIDGLDECSDQRGLSRFLRQLKQTKVRICVSGRTESHRSFDLVVDHQVLIKAPQSDLVTYIKTYLEDDKELSMLLTDPNDFVLRLASYADGTFLLVRLALQNLSGVTTVRQVKQALANLPYDLRSAHQTTFTRIKSSSPAKRDIALKALAWILLAKRPLTMTELLHALAFYSSDFEFDPENIATSATILRACLGFLEHRENTDVVQFSHATVLEYLKSDCGEAFTNSGLMIARTCVRYLNQLALAFEPCQNATELVTRFDNHPLLPYAALHWGEHVFDFQTELTTDIQSLLASQNSVSNAAQTFHYLRRARGSPRDAIFLALPKDFGKVHLLTLWGLSDIAILESLSYDEIVAPDSLGWSPIHWAAARGHPDMIDFLLLRGADLEVKDARDWTPLYWAVFWGRLSAVRYLLNKGASLYVVGNDGNTLMHTAIQKGDTDVCRELLDRNVEWNIKSADGISAWEEGLRSSIPEVASMFQTHSQTHDLTAKKGDDAGETALEQAVAWSPSTRSSIFRTTLAREEKAAKSKDWKRPLLLRLEQYLKRLVEKDPDHLTNIGWEVILSWFPEDLINQEDYKAAVIGYSILTERVEMVKAIIDAGVDLQKDWSRESHRIQYIQFPVLLAAYVGNTELIDLLIRHGASVEVADYEGRSPLHYCAILGHLDTARILCKYDSLRVSIDREGKSALHLVWSRLLRAEPDRMQATSVETLLTIAELLVRNGSNINLADSYGNTPLHYAVKTGELQPVQMLIKLGADLNCRAIDGKVFSHGDTPLTLACKKRKWNLASALHDAGATLPEEMDLRDPLVQIIADGDLPALQTLFSFASATHVAGKAYWQIPLIILAVRSLQWVMDVSSRSEFDFRRPFVKPQDQENSDAPERYRAVINFLLTKEQTPNDKDMYGSTALLEALEYEYNKDIVHLLLTYGADVLATNEDGKNALHVAASTGFTPFVELMLSHKVDVNHIASDGNTPLSLAAANGRGEVVSLLMHESNIHASMEDRQKHLQYSRCYSSIEDRNLIEFKNSVSSALPIHLTNRKGQTLLHLAADCGVPEIVITLLTLDIEIDAQDIRGDTALHIAAKSHGSNAKILKALLDGGANFQKRNHAGKTEKINRIPQDATALHLAAYAGQVENVRMLCEQKSTLHDNRTPSDFLQGRGGVDPTHTVGRMIDETSDRCGRTVLMCAVQSGSLPTVKYLLEAGASVNEEGGGASWGFCALDLAGNHGKQTDQGNESEMVKLLKSYGAKLFHW